MADLPKCFRDVREPRDSRGPQIQDYKGESDDSLEILEILEIPPFKRDPFCNDPFCRGHKWDLGWQGGSTKVSFWM